MASSRQLQKYDVEIEVSEDKRVCSHCGVSFGESAIVAVNRLWHPGHFLCYDCKKPISQNYQLSDNHPYHLNCFTNKFNPKCSGCNETLFERCLLANKKHWHRGCFKCTTCDKVLVNNEFYKMVAKPNEYYCGDCYWLQRMNNLSNGPFTTVNAGVHVDETNA